MKTIPELNIEKSKGHIAFFRPNYNNGNVTELYQYGNDLHLAPVSNAMDIEHGVRHGQYEHYSSKLDQVVSNLRSQSYEFVSEPSTPER